MAKMVKLSSVEDILGKAYDDWEKGDLLETKDALRFFDAEIKKLEREVDLKDSE